MAPVTRLPVYLQDFAVLKPPEHYRVDSVKSEVARERWICDDGQPLGAEVAEFMQKVFYRSGIGHNNTFLPPNVHPQHAPQPDTSFNAGMAECHTVMEGVIGEVLRKTGLEPTDIDILVTASSIFCPTPSVASMVINMFKMREDINSYNLGGMGCANGCVAINLVHDLLQAHPNSVALFIATDICSTAAYLGRDHHGLVSNCLFRMGGTAAILTNKPQALRGGLGAKGAFGSAKYQLTHHERVTTSANDASYNCLRWGSDDNGTMGMMLYPELPVEAGACLEKCLIKITPKILSWGQYSAAAANYAQQYLWGADKVPKWRPDYTQCCNYFCLHAGGYAVLKGVMKGMGLPAEKVLPSFTSLRDYGNTGASTTWYTFACIESTHLISKGETVMQLGVGGGIKAGINVWRALRTFKDVHPAWVHLRGRLPTEAELPRPINTVARANSRQATMRRANSGAIPAAAAAASLGRAGKDAAGKGSAENGKRNKAEQNGQDTQAGARDQHPQNPSTPPKHELGSTSPQLKQLRTAPQPPSVQSSAFGKGTGISKAGPQPFDVRNNLDRGIIDDNEAHAAVDTYGASFGAARAR